MVVAAVCVGGYHSFGRVAVAWLGVGEGDGNHGAASFKEKTWVATQVGVVVHVFHAGVVACIEPAVEFFPGLGADRRGLGKAYGACPGCEDGLPEVLFLFLKDVGVDNRIHGVKISNFGNFTKL